MSKLVAHLALFWVAIAVPSRLSAQVDRREHSIAELKALFRYEATGLSLPYPYVRGKVPVVFVHGLWASPSSWHRMIEALEVDSELGSRFQFWTFGYSTGDPIAYSAYLLRKNLDELREKLDPRKADPAFDRMVIVGHSMGGLLSKMIVVESGNRLWRLVSDRPPSELMGEEKDRSILHDGLIFTARKGVRRVIYIATPHRGSQLDDGLIERVGTRLVRVPDPLRAAHTRLLERNQPRFFTEEFREGLPTSIEELQWGSPTLLSLTEMPHSPVVKVHSIVAVLPGSPPDHRTDGLVPYESAHVAGIGSEKIVSAGHLCQENSEVISEVRRVLFEHTKTQ
jgi:pimeloyl-ACP methyl ester carboxylesterase